MPGGDVPSARSMRTMRMTSPNVARSEQPPEPMARHRRATLFTASGRDQDGESFPPTRPRGGFRNLATALRGEGRRARGAALKSTQAAERCRVWVRLMRHAAAGQHLNPFRRRPAACARGPDEILTLGFALFLDEVADEAAAHRRHQRCRGSVISRAHVMMLHTRYA